MDVREIRDTAAWDRYAVQWSRIAEASPRATVFQTWEWTRAWWDHFGRNRRLWVLVFEDGGQPAGFAALFLPPPAAPLRVGRLLGTGGSDYLDLLALPDQEGAVRDALWRFLAERRRTWDWLDLQQLRPGGVLREADPPSGPVRGSFWPGETCPYLPLPETWEAFRKSLGKKLRGNIGYYERALAKQYVVEMRTATKETLTDDITAFFDLHQRRWNRRWLPGAFVTTAARAFHEDVSGRLLERGWLRLHTLDLDGETLAALYCFQFGARCVYYLGGFEPTLARFSIGTVLTAQAIRYAIEQDQATEFDFVRGDEPYKYKWGAQDRSNARLSVTQTGVRSLALAGSGRAALAAELALKSWMHRRHGGKERDKNHG